MSQRKSVTGGKRKRDPTFTASEKITLLELIENHFHIVESKKTDALTMRNKNDEWQKIEVEFNAISNIYPRDSNVLKNCWDNLKKRAKQELTQRNQHHLGTGGGLPNKCNEDPVNERVLALIKSRVSGYLNVHDSDSTSILAAGSFGPTPDNSQTQPSASCNEPLPGSCEGEIIISGYNIDTSPKIEKIEHHIETVDWSQSQYTPSMLRNPALKPSPPNFKDLTCIEQQTPLLGTNDHPHHPVITPRNQTCAPATASTSRRRPTLRRNKEVQSLAIARISTLKLANTHAQEEHDLKMKIVRLQEEQELLKKQQEMLKLQILEEQLKKIKE